MRLYVVMDDRFAQGVFRRREKRNHVAQGSQRAFNGECPFALHALREMLAFDPLLHDAGPLSRRKAVVFVDAAVRDRLRKHFEVVELQQRAPFEIGIVRIFENLHCDGQPVGRFGFYDRGLSAAVRYFFECELLDA